MAGFLATLPMTGLMGILYEMLPRSDRYPLPPWQGTKQILLEAAEALDEKALAEDRKVTAATVFTHFGYGAASGAAYALTAARWPAHPLLKGFLAGLGLWSLSYGGILPALGILRPLGMRSAARNALMLFANLAWGLFTALLFGRFSPGNQEEER